MGVNTMDSLIWPKWNGIRISTIHMSYDNEDGCDAVWSLIGDLYIEQYTMNHSINAKDFICWLILNGKTFSIDIDRMSGIKKYYGELMYFEILQFIIKFNKRDFLLAKLSL